MNHTAILLVNLGSPESPTSKDLKPYLTEFLMDERVIDVPLFWRNILVKGIIVPFRSSKSAAKYKSIWTADGSPLVSHTKEQCRLLQKKLDMPVFYSMRYGSPATADVLKKIHAENPLLKDLIVLPLYPHYAMSSYETAIVQVKDLHKERKYASALHIIPAFYDHPQYIRALSKSIEPYLQAHYDHVLFSYHGIPERHVRKTDCTSNHCLQSTACCETPSPAHNFCYRHQVITTTNMVAKQLGLQRQQFSYSFQSRLGRDPWLKPFTFQLLELFPKAGIKKLLVICPAFVSDCLETLEEIAMEGKQAFLKYGGEEFTLIPCLNENQEWIDCMEDLITKATLTQVTG